LFASRRRVLASLASAAIAGIARPSLANTLPAATVWKDRYCGCCSLWAEHLRRHGFPVTLVDTPDMQAVKARHGVPEALMSCHTATIGPYVIEGHVPAHAILRLLREQPVARGLAVPGMPAGSPGMEGGRPEFYEVVLFGKGAPGNFGRYLGDRPA
jgi:hypothetical protein